MIADTLLLLQLRWQLNWNNWRKRTRWRKILTLVGVLWLTVLGGGLSGAIGWGSAAVVRRFLGAGLEPLVPGLILTAAALILLFSAFSIALGSLFFSNDLELLMVAPVNRRAVFLSKLLDGIAWYYAILAITAVPGLFAYGWRLGYQVWYFLFALLTLLGAPLLTAGIGALAVMLVARFAPAHRVREVLGFVAAIFGLSCSLLGQTSRLWAERFEQFESDPQALLAAVERFSNVPLPTLVAGRGLAAAGYGRVGASLLDLAVFLLITFGFFALCVVLADSLYTSGWTRMQSTGTARRSARDQARARRGGALVNAPSLLTIALKDWRVIPRDLRNFAQMLSPLLLVPIIYINIVTNGGPRGQANISQFLGRFEGGGPLTLIEIGLAGSVLFIASLVFTRVALTSISMEGKSWWLLKAAPLGSWELLRGKFLSAYIPFVGLHLLLMLGAAIWRRFSLLAFTYTTLGTLILGAGVMAVCVGLSVPWARLDWDDPRRMSSGWGGLIAFIIQTTYTLIGLAFLALPALAAMWLPAWAPVAWLIGPAGALVLTFAVSFPILSFGVQRLARVGES